MTHSRLALFSPDRVGEESHPETKEDRPPSRSRPDSTPSHSSRSSFDSPPGLPAMLAGMLLLVAAHPLVWRWELPGVWFPPAGIGFLLAAWLGPRAALLVVGAELLVALQALLLGTLLPWGNDLGGIALATGGALLSGLEVWAAWWCYFHLARGQRDLIDPRSATSFLVIVPGLLAVLFAAGHAALAWPAAQGGSFGELLRSIWFSRALGLVAVAPPWLVLATHTLNRRGWIIPEPPYQNCGSDAVLPIPLGGRIEIAGLAFATGLFGLFLTLHHGQGNWSAAPLTTLPLLFIIWASLRQGVRGGTLVATTMAVPALTILSLGREANTLLALQANLLAQCSTALLIGVSFNWIRANEARYRHVVEHVPVVLYSGRLPRQVGKTPQPKSVEITFVSQAALSVLGRGPTELLGSYENWMDCVHDDDRELLLAALTQLWRFKESVTCEYRLATEVGQRRRPDEDSEMGKLLGAARRTRCPEHWVRDTLVPQFDEDGRLIGWEGVAEDITEQRNLADDLRRATGLLHTLVNNLPTGVFFVEARSGRPILVNARARQLLGQREEMSAGMQHLADVYRLHRPDGSRYPADEVPVCLALRRGTVCMSDDLVVHRSDGQRIALVSWAAPIDLSGLGRYDAAVWVLEDLSALRQAETNLRETESRLRSVIEHLSEGVLILDDKGVILDSNTAAGGLLGVPPGELKGQAITAVSQGFMREDGWPLDAEEHPAILCGRTRQPVGDMVLGLCRGGFREEAATVRWLLTRAIPCPPGTGRVAPRVVLILGDVTPQRALQTDHRRFEVGLEHAQRLSLMGQLARGLVHDFNNHFTAILGGAEMAANELPAEHPVQSDLKAILEAVEKAGQTTQRMLALGAAQKAAVQPCDLNDLIQRTLPLLKGALGREIRVELELSEAKPLVQAREQQLVQVVLNLCLNARDAMPRGGRLTIATILAPDTSMVVLQVRDTGPGLSEKVRKNLFRMPVSDKEGCAGLGLWLSHRIITEHGGEIAIHPGSESGTCVEIRLPISV